ncbi:hypothetical protein AB4Z38_03905 [Arthrobacter sp. 2RAF6]|uniref:hypothetical protein n=1 Tax=Arthrobacter sp. 2RAF6 TaxID=3233002 RepID=UPI003F91B3DE
MKKVPRRPWSFMIRAASIWLDRPASNVKLTDESGATEGVGLLFPDPDPEGPWLRLIRDVAPVKRSSTDTHEAAHRPARFLEVRIGPDAMPFPRGLIANPRCRGS